MSVYLGSTVRQLHGLSAVRSSLRRDVDLLLVDSQKSRVGRLLDTCVASPVALAIFRLHVVIERPEPASSFCHAVLCAVRLAKHRQSRLPGLMPQTWTLLGKLAFMQLLDLSRPLWDYVLGSWAADAASAWKLAIVHLKTCYDKCLKVCTQPTLLLIGSPTVQSVDVMFWRIKQQ